MKLNKNKGLAPMPAIEGIAMTSIINGSNINGNAAVLDEDSSGRSEKKIPTLEFSIAINSIT